MSDISDTFDAEIDTDGIRPLDPAIEAYRREVDDADRQMGRHE